MRKTIQCKIISCGTYSALSTRSHCHAVHPYWTNNMLVKQVINSKWINCMTTRSHWKFRICTTTNDLTLYSFSSLYIFVTRGWPTVAETCRQPNKTDTKTVVFWCTYPLLICILVYRNLLDLASEWHQICSIYCTGLTSGLWFMVHKIFLLQWTSRTHTWSLASLSHSVYEFACRYQRRQ